MNYKSLGWRRFARWGAMHGPDFFVRLAPIAIGLVFFALQGKTRRALIENQKRIEPGRGRLATFWAALLTVIRFAQCLTEGWGERRAETRVLGSERLETILEQPAGLIIVTAHVGPWDGAAQELARRFERPVLLVMDAEREQEAAELQDQQRGMAGVSVIRLGSDSLAALPLLEHLRGGGIAALQLDRAPRGRPAAVAPLFGRPFPVPTGPYLLAGLARVPVLPVFSARTGHFRRQVHIGRPVWPHRRPSTSQLRAWIEDVLAQLEDHVRAFSDQWFHFVTADEETARLVGLERESVRTRRRHLARRTGVEAGHLAKAPP